MKICFISNDIDNLYYCQMYHWATWDTFSTDRPTALKAEFVKIAGISDGASRHIRRHIAVEVEEALNMNPSVLPRTWNVPGNFANAIADMIRKDFPNNVALSFGYAKKNEDLLLCYILEHLKITQIDVETGGRSDIPVLECMSQKVQRIYKKFCAARKNGTLQQLLK